MNIDAVMNGLVEIIKAGGPMALWGVGIWLIFGLIRTGFLCLIIYLIVKVICGTITDNYKVSKELNRQKIQLLSEEVSRTLLTSLETFTKQTEALLKDIEKQLAELKKPSAEK